MGAFCSYNKMHVIVILVFVCLLFAPGAFSQKTQTDRDLGRLVGNVHIIREYRTSSEFELAPAELCKLLEAAPYETVTYNREGDLLEKDYRYGFRYTFSYNADRLRVLTAHGDISPGSGSPIGAYISRREADRFDSSRRKIETITYLRDESKPWARKTYEYDDKDRIHKVFDYWREPDGSLKLNHIINFSFEANSSHEKEVCWRDAGDRIMDTLSYSNYKHDPAGNWVKRTEARVQVYDKDQPKVQSRKIYRFITYY
jgi:hypothetical protein